MEKFLKKAGWSNIITSIVFAIIGILLIVKADAAIKAISYVLGGIFIVLGAIKMLNYFSNKEDNKTYNNLLFGLISIILGLLIIFNSGAIEFIFRIVVGVWIIYSGVSRLFLAIRLNKIGVPVWNLSLVIAILMIIAGIFVMFTKGALIKTTGIVVLVYAIMDLIQSIIDMKNVGETNLK